jgi:ABC-type sugar transport system ATPase subunit
MPKQTAAASDAEQYTMSEIRLDNLRKEFGSLVAVRDTSMTFPSGTVTCLLGPSGCGKTTLMRMIAGLETPSRGDVYFGAQKVTDLSPSQRNIGMVFQYPVVYRGMSVYRNIELPLIEDQALSPEARKQRILEVMETLDLTAAANLDVSQLDNGTRQKVAVARAVARQPKIILFDEPITNVDVGSKIQLKRALKRLVKQHNQTIIYVTHDQTEAMTLADEILLMLEGAIVQRGTPRDLYNHPNDRFGGFFLGNPGMNFVDVPLERSAGGATLARPLFAQAVPVTGVEGQKEIVVGIRPERIRVYAKPQPQAVEAMLVRSALVVGGQRLLTLHIGDTTLKAKVADQHLYREGDRIYVECPTEHVILFDRDGHRLGAVAATARA